MERATAQLSRISGYAVTAFIYEPDGMLSRVGRQLVSSSLAG
jgi:hypothetical protein